MRTFTTSCILAGIVAVSAASPDTAAAHLDVGAPRRAIQHARPAQDGEHRPEHRPEHHGTHHRPEHNGTHHRPEHNGTHHRPEHNGTHHGPEHNGTHHRRPHRRPHHGKHNGTELSREVHAAQFDDVDTKVQYGEHNGTHHGPHHGGQHNGTHHGPHHGGQHNGTHHGPHHGGQHNGTHHGPHHGGQHNGTHHGPHHRRPHPTRDAGDAEPLDFRPPTHGPFVLVGVAALAAGVAFFIGRRRRATEAADPAHAGKLCGTYDAVPATPTDTDAKHVDEIDVVAV